MHMSSHIKNECLLRLNALRLPKAAEILAGGELPIFDTRTGSVFEADAPHLSRAGNVRLVYGRTPYLIAKIHEPGIGAFLLFCSVSADPNCWKREREETVRYGCSSCRLCGPTYVPSEKRYYREGSVCGSFNQDCSLRICASSAFRRRLIRTRAGPGAAV